MKCVYGIFENDKLIYIGSTTNFIERRKQHKRNSFNEKYKPPIYQYIRQKCNVFDECFTIKPIVDVEPETPKDILKSLEKDYINMVGLENLFNVTIPVPEWNEEEYNKQYYEKKKEYYQEYSKQYREKKKQEKNLKI